MADRVPSLTNDSIFPVFLVFLYTPLSSFVRDLCDRGDPQSLDSNGRVVGFMGFLNGGLFNRPGFN